KREKRRWPARLGSPPAGDAVSLVAVAGLWGADPSSFVGVSLCSGDASSELSWPHPADARRTPKQTAAQTRRRPMSSPPPGFSPTLRDRPGNRPTAHDVAGTGQWEWPTGANPGTTNGARRCLAAGTACHRAERRRGATHQARDRAPAGAARPY